MCTVKPEGFTAVVVKDIYLISIHYVSFPERVLSKEKKFSLIPFISGLVFPIKLLGEPAFLGRFPWEVCAGLDCPGCAEAISGHC